MSQTMWMLGGSSIDLPPQPASSRILDIRFPDTLRARKVVTRSRARMTGKHPSWKVGRSVQWESRHEQKAFMILDCNPTVRSYSEQPCEVSYWDGERERLHVPDILVEFDNRRELWEIKDSEACAAQDVLIRTRIMSGLSAHGYVYRLISGAEVSAKPRLEVAYRLLLWGYHPISIGEKEVCRQQMLMTGRTTWSSVEDGLLGRRGRQIISRATLEGLVHVEPSLEPGELIFQLAEQG